MKAPIKINYETIRKHGIKAHQRQKQEQMAFGMYRAMGYGGTLNQSTFTITVDNTYDYRGLTQVLEQQNRNWNYYPTEQTDNQGLITNNNFNAWNTTNNNAFNWTTAVYTTTNPYIDYVQQLDRTRRNDNGI